MIKIFNQGSSIIFAGLLVPALIFLSGQTFSSDLKTKSIQDTSSPQASPEATQTPDQARLLEPTLPAEPLQADVGAQDYWLNCMPCHGDIGQGLTDEFRQLYPEEDRNCWASGCHGERPYENGFQVPTVVPAIIGPGLLDKYRNASGLYSFVHAAMPREAPGSLSDEVYWQLVAFLLRENGYDFPEENLGPENAEIVFMGDQPEGSEIVTPSPGEADNRAVIELVRGVHSPAQQNSSGYIWLIAAILGAGVFFYILLMKVMKDESKSD
jgi:hypothetical protein